jgi:hypothetical protein
MSSLELDLTSVLTPTDRCSCPRVRVLAYGVGWRLARPDPGMVGAQTGPDHARVGVVAQRPDPPSSSSSYRRRYRVNHDRTRPIAGWCPNGPDQARVGFLK